MLSWFFYIDPDSAANASYPLVDGIDHLGTAVRIPTLGQLSRIMDSTCICHVLRSQIYLVQATPYNMKDHVWVNPLTAKLFNLNFNPLEVVSR